MKKVFHGKYLIWNSKPSTPSFINSYFTLENSFSDLSGTRKRIIDLNFTSFPHLIFQRKIPLNEKGAKKRQLSHAF
jgi:hypothetical protein